MPPKFQMRGALGCLFAVAVVGTVHVTAHAQVSEPIRVELGSGAEDCPDASSLVERVGHIRGRAVTLRPSDPGYDVSFPRTDDAYRATIRSGSDGQSQRVLEGRGPTCAALAQATAVTLALLFDSQADAPAPEPEPKPEPKPPPKPEPTPLDEPVPDEAPHQAPRVAATASLGASGMFGVLRPVAPAFGAELGLHLEGFRAALGVLWVPTQTLDLDPGHVSEQLLAGTARTCLSLTRARGLSLDVCSGLIAGVVEARADGFTRNAQRVRSWLAVPLELSLAELSGSVGWEISAAALGSLVHHDFEVDGLGTPYHAPRIGGMVSLRAVGLLPL